MAGVFLEKYMDTEKDVHREDGVRDTGIVTVSSGTSEASRSLDGDMSQGHLGPQILNYCLQMGGSNFLFSPLAHGSLQGSPSTAKRCFLSCFLCDYLAHLSADVLPSPGLFS